MCSQNQKDVCLDVFEVICMVFLCCSNLHTCVVDQFFTNLNCKFEYQLHILFDFLKCLISINSPRFVEVKI